MNDKDIKKSKNFIDEIAESIILMAPECHIDIVYASSHAILGSITGDKIFTVTYKGPMSADIMTLIVAESGADKTLAYKPAKVVAGSLGLLIPASFTTESIHDYFAKKKENGEYQHQNKGLIPWDEASAKFSDDKNKSYKAGTIELLSSIYNHSLDIYYFKKEATIENPQKPYVSLLGNMVPRYFSSIPEYFFAQGIAGRIHWVGVEPDPPKPLDKQPDFNDLTNYNKGMDELTNVIQKLEKLDKKFDDLKKPILVEIDDDANQQIKKFKFDTETTWYSGLQNNPFGWDFQYFKRLPEMACKAALRYAIGDNADDITKLEYINKEYMERGISFVKKSSRALEDLFLKSKAILSTIKSPKLRAMRTLMEATNQMLNAGQWRKASGVPSPNQMTEIKNELVAEGSVIQVDKNSIQDKMEQQRLAIHTPAKIYKWVGR